MGYMERPLTLADMVKRGMAAQFLPCGYVNAASPFGLGL